MIEIDISKTLHGSSGVMPLRVEVNIEDGEFIALTGASGSGKTTLLRILAGLEEAKGVIRVNNETWLKESYSLPPQKRQIGFVFQDYALFDNMTVLENLLFANNDKALAQHLLEITELLPLANRTPKTLSGGQKQRVSLARAFMRKPKLLLMDEPLSALDPTIRIKLQNEIYKLHKEFKTTTIMVSHDPSEIFKLADRIILLENGAITNFTSPEKLYLKEHNTNLNLQGELLKLTPTDALTIAVVAIGQQIIKVPLSNREVKNFKVGQKVIVESNPFSTNLKTNL